VMGKVRFETQVGTKIAWKGRTEREKKSGRKGVILQRGHRLVVVILQGKTERGMQANTNTGANHEDDENTPGSGKAILCKESKDWGGRKRGGKKKRGISKRTGEDRISNTVKGLRE